ncbi:GntR family transcriptional regulator [Sphingobium aquiterrae]|uniref:GntR family transcriptional regulator n=1 Tax=Sphingobium aquiterrae TaxID=2038656 RepID=UPI003016FE97|tara:strand:- start:13357 stop:13971 length:615 start_codon:yes stop_codon:yes gene_type:complete
MNVGQTTARVHEALRRRIVMHEIRPGARIDPSEIASEFGMSVTPPRDALHMLVGEGLAEIRHGEGFFVPEIDEQGLKDLYDWNLDLILAAWRRGKPTPGTFPSLVGDPITQTEAFFGAIARSSGSRLHVLAMRWANARLGAARRVEANGLFDATEELAAIAAALSSGDSAAARRLVADYHNRRKSMAMRIVDGLYGSAGTNSRL